MSSRLPSLFLCSLVAALPALVLSACGLTVQRIAPKAAAAVAAYCREPQAVRLALRAQVAEAVRPNAVRIDCAGDQTSEDRVE